MDEDFDSTAGAVEVANSNRLIADLKNSSDIWGYSLKGTEAKKAAMAMISTKTGMYAKVPLICKADSCPYVETCKLIKYDLAPEGEPCPIETSQIEVFGKGYAEDIGYDEASFTDRRMVSDLIRYDVMLERCMALMSKEGTPVIDVLMGIAENGEEIHQPMVSKAWEAYEKISKKRNDTYQLLMMTRKDNKKVGDDENESLSDMLASVINQESE